MVKERMESQLNVKIVVLIVNKLINSKMFFYDTNTD
jgi:hypothetical protein